MKADFLSSGSADCPLLRLFDFTFAEVAALRDTFLELAAGKIRHRQLKEFVSLEANTAIQLTFEAGSTDAGVVPGTNASFAVILTPTGWEQVAGLVEPFLDGDYGYQWLVEGRVRLLLSKDGSW